MPWTPDGRAVLVRKMLAAGGETSELWLVPIAGESPRKLDFDANRVVPCAPGKIRLHPDGLQIAFVAGEYRNEVWPRRWASHCSSKEMISLTRT
jgi:hypothetical protein